MKDRKSGILLHITSLPGGEGIGTLGKEAFRFVDFLKECGQKIWQILPLGPVGYGNSPYQCYSAFAGNPLLIDLELLSHDKLLPRDFLSEIPRIKARKTEFEKIEKWKYPLLQTAFDAFRKVGSEELRNEYRLFLNEHGWWLESHALFMAIKGYFEGADWHLWDRPVKFREEQALQRLREELADEIEVQRFWQFLFFRQWHRLKKYANENGVGVFGDVPLYVSGDSSDVWANTDIFMLDEDLEPIQVGGVPPDYFSETGQLWGNPVFNWPRLKERNYDWWSARFHFNLRMFDQVRIDHFRGLESFWSIPAGEKTAMNGAWTPAYGYDLLKMIKSHLGELAFIAEDLGIITPQVEKLRTDFGLPGMKVLQFAFASDARNVDLPHNYGRNFVVYTGTHDNDTTLGWLRSVKGEEKNFLKNYIDRENEEGLQQLVEMAMASVARTAIIPMQDVLELGTSSRMNTPGTADGNWAWRFKWEDLKKRQKQFLKEITEKYNR